MRRTLFGTILYSALCPQCIWSSKLVLRIVHLTIDIEVGSETTSLLETELNCNRKSQLYATLRESCLWFVVWGSKLTAPALVHTLDRTKWIRNSISTVIYIIMRFGALSIQQKFRFAFWKFYENWIERLAWVGSVQPEWPSVWLLFLRAGYKRAVLELTKHVLIAWALFQHLLEH